MIVIIFLFFRAVVSPAKALLPAIRPLLNAALQSILLTVSRVFPHAEMGLKRKREQGAVLLYLVILALLLHACYVHHRSSFKKSKTERNNKKMWHTQRAFFIFFNSGCNYLPVVFVWPKMWPVLFLMMIWCSVRKRTLRSAPLDRPPTPNTKHLLLTASWTSTGRTHSLKYKVVFLTSTVWNQF